VRDFDPAYVGRGSFASIPRCSRYVRLCSKSGDKPDMETLRVRANSGSRPYSITSSAQARSAGGLRDQLRQKPWPRRSTSWTSITSVAGAILVNAPTLGGWYLLQGQAVAISRTTGIYALLFSGLSRRKGKRGEIGVTRIECSRTQ
jgi:hypothetical protein